MHGLGIARAGIQRTADDDDIGKGRDLAAELAAGAKKDLRVVVFERDVELLEAQSHATVLSDREKNGNCSAAFPEIPEGIFPFCRSRGPWATPSILAVSGLRVVDGIASAGSGWMGGVKRVAFRQKVQ